MRHREPSDVAVMAARVARAYPTLSPYSAARIAVEFCAIERMTKLHAERQCNDADYQVGMVRWRRARSAIENSLLRLQTQLQDWNAVDSRGVVVLPTTETGGDPRGATFKVRLPGEKELQAV